MKKLLVLICTIYSVTAWSWWFPAEKIQVTCKADAELFPEISQISARGFVLTIQDQGNTHSKQAKVSQSYNAKIWEMEPYTLSVALQNRGNTWYSGVLTVKQGPNQFLDIPLWCYPKSN